MLDDEHPLWQTLCESPLVVSEVVVR